MTDERFQNTAQPDRDWWSTLWPDPEATLRRLGLDEDHRVLDVCCGDGHFTLAMARVVAPNEVVALDIDEALLDGVAERTAAAGLENVTTRPCDARNVPAHVDGRYDFALLANTIHGADEPVDVIRSVRSLLTTEARFAVVNWHVADPVETRVLDEPRGPPEAIRMTPDETRRIGIEAGLDVVGRVELPPHHYGVVFQPGSDD